MRRDSDQTDVIPEAKQERRAQCPSGEGFTSGPTASLCSGQVKGAPTIPPPSWLCHVVAEGPGRGIEPLSRLERGGQLAALPDVT